VPGVINRLRSLVLGVVPTPAVFGLYRVVRSFPRLFFGLRRLIMGELAGSR